MKYTITLCKLGDPKFTESIDRMAHYLGVEIAMLVTGYAPNLIVVVGEVTHMWERVGPIINRIVAEKSPQATATRITPLDGLAHTPLCGAIALVLQKHFVAPAVA